jgi:serine/threonine protein kinase
MASSAQECATQNILTSAEESFDATPHIPQDGNIQTIHVQPSSTRQLANVRRMSPLWSVEHHPLSLSKYQRDFHQVSLLATGSFGSVYHAIHKLEHRPYAVKCVTLSTTGYYANMLALVIREVRCLAQLDHPNCVRYYTSWLGEKILACTIRGCVDSFHAGRCRLTFA